jgi:hypothetical protein
MVADTPTIPLQGRLYGEKAGDWQEVSSWWQGRGEMFAETILPPLGVVVEQAGEMIAALWCYESFGIGVAFLEFPCTKPGIPPGLAFRGLAWAEHAIITILRSKGGHKLVRAFAQPRHAVAMRRMGYQQDRESCIGFMRRID